MQRVVGFLSCFILFVLLLFTDPEIYFTLPEPPCSPHFEAW